MKIVFFGTPDFAVPSLEILHKSNHEVAAVVTAPDKQRGRGQKVSYTAVKEFAVGNNLPVLQPEKMKDPEFISALQATNADLFVIVAFRILPPEVYKMPQFGSFNLHGSILPKYRGAAPIQWSIINGDKETGVTTFFLQDKVDTGNIITIEKLQIKPEDDYGSIYYKLSTIGAELVLKTVNSIEEGSVETKVQDESLATPAPKITKETCLIDWNKPAEEINNLVRGLSPVPGAYFIHNEKTYKIYKSVVSEEFPELKPGEIKETKKDVFVGTTDKNLQLLEIQPEGRKRMEADAFLRGYSFHK